MHLHQMNPFNFKRRATVKHGLQFHRSKSFEFP
jgi:hypothetical protein